MRERHCNNETLLRFADGELPPPQAWRARRHLRSCWECRARLMELDEQIRAARHTVRSEPFPAAQIEQARRRFRAWERSNGAALWQSQRRRTALPAGIAATILLTLTALWWLRREAAPDARGLLAEVERIETQAPAGHFVVRRELRIELRNGSRPAPAAQVEIVTEPATGRSAARWRDPAGVLRYACWRPDGQRSIRYESGRLRPITAISETPLLAGLAAASLDTEALERVIVEWVFSRQWRPVSLAAEARSFADGHGGSLTVRRRTEKADRILAVEIRRTLGRRTIEVVLILDEATRRPRLETIRLEESGQAVIIRLIPVRVELVAAARVQASWFQPEVAGPRRPLPPPRRVPPAVRAAAAPTDAELLSAELQALTALHDERVCLGEPVEVRRTGAAIEITGLVSGEDKKQALLARLAPLAFAGIVSVRLTTLEEAATQTGAAAGQAPARAGTALTETRTGIQAVDDLLATYFRRQGATGPQETARRVTDFANRAVTLAEAALAEAWALRRLVERFPDPRAARLDARSLYRLERLAVDHLSALHAELERAQQLWQGPLETFIPPAMPAANTAEWADLAGELFHQVQQYHALVHSLLAGAGTVTGSPEEMLERLALLLDRSSDLAARLEHDPGLRSASQWAEKQQDRKP